MKFLYDTLITFSAQIIAVIFGIITAIIIARILGPEGKGIYTLVILIPSMLVLLGNLGIGIANTYFGGSKKYNWDELASISFISSLLLGITLSIIFLTYYFIVHPIFLSEIKTQCIVLAAMTVPFNLFTTYFQCILMGQKRFLEYNLVNVLQNGVLVILVIIVLFFLERGISEVILTWLIATIITTAFSFFFVRKTTSVKWVFSYPIFKALLKFGSIGYLSNIITFLNYRIDMILVSSLVTPAIVATTLVGYYSVSVSLAEALWYFPGAVGTIVFARTVGLNNEEADKTTPKICRNTFFITFIFALILLALSKRLIILLFGVSFLPALRPLYILIPGIIIFSICKVLCNEITGRGKPLINIVAAGISLLVNIPLNLLLIPRMGIEGAALASTISYSACAFIVLIMFLRISQAKFSDIVIIKKEDLQLYTAVLLSGLKLVLKGSIRSYHVLNGLSERKD